jgi:hypothetical protein
MKKTRPQKKEEWKVEPLPSDPFAQLFDPLLRLDRRLALEAERTEPKPELAIIT